MILYVRYLIITKAFNDMGFSSLEATIIVIVSFLLGSGIVDEFVGFSFCIIHLFVFGNWIVGMNTGCAIIPVILSTYLKHYNYILDQSVEYNVKTRPRGEHH